MNKKYKVKCKKEKGRNKKTFWYYFSEMLKIERQKKKEKSLEFVSIHKHVE
jgi:hypothetical protein